MSVSNTPAVNFMLQYTKPHANYVDYTNRKEAIDNKELEFEKSQRQVSENANEFVSNFLKDIDSNISEQNLNFEKYVDYMNRSYAVKDDENNTSAFNERTFNLTPNDLRTIKENLIIAKKNESLLWKGVISFDNDFLAKNGLYDPKTNILNQEAIKTAIQKSMKHVLKREKIPSAFWWGNIHLNTDNIHVHIGISELSSTRPKIIYKGIEQYKGNFSQKTINSVKSLVYNRLTNEVNKNRQIQFEQKISYYKRDLIEDITTPAFNLNNNQKKLIELAYKNLPDINIQKWRYGSNSKSMKISKKYIEKYIDNYLNSEGKDSFEGFKTQTTALLKEYEFAYSKNNMVNIDELIENRIDDLKERIGNRILKYIADNSDKISTNSDKKLLYRETEFLSTDQLSELIDSYKDIDLSSAQKLDLGVLKSALRSKNIEGEIVELQTKVFSFSEFRPTKHDEEFISLKKNQYKNRLEYLKLSKKPNYRLSTDQKKLKKTLHQKSINPLNIPIKKVTSNLIESYKKNIQNEIDLISHLDDKTILACVTDKGTTDYINELKSKVKVLDIKGEINQNNSSITRLEKNNENPELVKELKKQNGYLFKKLKKSMNSNNELQNATNKIQNYGNSRQTNSINSTHNSIKYTSKLSAINEIHQSRLNKQNQSVSKGKIPSFKPDFLQGLNKAVSIGTKKDLDAMVKKIETDKRIEIQELREEQEEKRKGYSL